MADMIWDETQKNGGWTSTLKDLEYVAERGIPLNVVFVANTSIEAVAAIFLESKDGDRICVPWRLNSRKAKPSIGEAVMPIFGDIYYSDAHQITLNHSTTVELSQWEEPTRFLLR